MNDCPENRSCSGSIRPERCRPWSVLWVARWLRPAVLASIAVLLAAQPTFAQPSAAATGTNERSEATGADAAAKPDSADAAAQNAGTTQQGTAPTPVDVAEDGQAPAGNGPTDAPSRRAARDLPRQGIPTTPLEIFLAMGIWGVPFVIASVVAVWFTVERLVVLRRGRVIPRDFVDRFLTQLRTGQLDQTAALEACEESGSPVAVIFAHGIRKWGKPSVEVEQAIIDGGERETARLRKHLRVLNGTATVTPLFGLLGTVVGMIRAFNGLATASVAERPEQLAVGIALALLTTACGLAVAIPSLIAYIYFTGRVDTLVMEMDELAQQVVQLVSAEGLAQKPAPTRSAESPAAAGVPSGEPLTEATP